VPVPIIETLWALQCVSFPPESKNEGTVGAIDGTVQRLSQGIQDATANVRGGLSDVGNKANHMSLRSKVTDRLGKEGSIDDDRIEVEIKDEGTVVLSGQVPDAADKEMAVRIASATDGVIRVEDRLSVPANLRVFTSKPEDNAPVPRRTR
jgi:osmotically-inducible protein OsmY